MTQYPPPPGQQPYPPQGYAPMPPAPKKRKWPWIVGGIVLLFVIIGVANGGGSATPTNATTTPTAAASAAAAPTIPAVEQPPPAAEPAGSVVVYEVTGSGTAGNVTYMKEGFSQEQQTSAKLPWRKELQFEEKVGGFAPLSLVAQNGANSGDITCRITVDGEVVGESTSNGQYAVVTCTGNG